MLSTLSITAPAPGMIYVNGRFAGEVSDAAPLLMPTLDTGALYLQYHPLEEGWLPTARRITLSHGRPAALPADVFAIVWPSNLLEMELSPPRLPAETTQTANLDGLEVRLLRGWQTCLEIGSLRCPLPDRAGLPQLLRATHCLALTGQDGDGQYLLTLTADAARQTGMLAADRLEWESGEIVRTTTFQRDVAGHATTERWLADASGLQLLSSEAAWEDGAPRLPATPEETARAAVEAALLGLHDEAERYLSPALRVRISMKSLTDAYQACLSMKPSLSDGLPCVGLLRMERENLGVIHPLQYQAERSENGWLLTALELLS